MTRTLTIISGAGIVVLVLMPVWVVHRLWTTEQMGDIDVQSLVATKALLVSLVVLGVSVSGALALIIIKLFDRHFRG